jgi:hypothetical protein
LVNKNEPIFCSAEPKKTVFRLFYDERYSEDNFAELEAILRIIYPVTGSRNAALPSAATDRCSTVRHSIPLFIDGHFTEW